MKTFFRYKVIIPALFLFWQGAGAALTTVIIDPSEHDAGSPSRHDVSFYTQAVIPADGKIVVEYDTGTFGVGTVTYASTPTAGNPGHIDGGFSVTHGTDEVTVTRDGTGTPIPATSYVIIRLHNVTNTTLAGSYTARVETKNAASVDIEAGISDAFTIDPAVLHHFTVTGMPASRTAGQPFGTDIVVTAYDAYNNLKTDYTGNVNWTSTDLSADLPTDDGSGWSAGQNTFSAGGFILYTTGSRTVTVTDQSNPSVYNTSGSINVTQDIINGFTLSCGTSQTAGNAFPLNVSSAQDQWGNAWSGTVTVSVTSGGGSAPRGDSPVIQNIAVTGGSGSAGQTLVNAVPTVIQGTAGTVTRSTGTITVSPNTLSDYTLTAGLSQTAGIGFALTVTGAEDYLENPWSGTVVIDASAGGNAAPDGTPPDLNNVIVTAGSGSATQTLTRTESTRLRGTGDATVRQTGVIQMSPGVISEFGLAGYPGSTIAGENFPDNVVVTAYDPFRNVKTNYTGSIHFNSSDPNAAITYNSGNPYTFVPADAGVHAFPGAAFSLRTAGLQVIRVRDNAPDPDVIEISSAIQVTHTDLLDFTLSANTTSQTAGVPFPLTVSGAEDQYGNAWSGIVAVSASAGGGNSPSGLPPNLQDIVVVGGTGSANQVLVNAESGVVLQGLADGRSAFTAALHVIPNPSLASMKIRNADNGAGNEVGIETIVVGDALVMYAAGYDAYGNYQGNESADWTSTGLTPQINALNTPSHTFVPAMPGSGTISVSDHATGMVHDHTGTITVTAGTIAGFEIGTIPTPQEVGQPFTIVIRAVDAEGITVNNFQGNVTISDVTGTIRPDSSGFFINGIWTGGVTVRQAEAADRITVEGRHGAASSITGQSNIFEVVPTPSIDITEYTALQADMATPLTAVTTDQTLDWYCKMVFRNIGSGNIEFDSAELQFVVDGVIRNDYSVSVPAVLWGNGSTLLAPGETDSLLMTVNTTGHDSGPATVYGVLNFTNMNGDPQTKQVWTTINVQTPADVRITSMAPSQTQVSRGQNEDWTVSMVLRNSGGSAVFIDSSKVRTFLTFSRGEDWNTARPDSLAGGGWMLSGGTTDTVQFLIRASASDITGNCRINGYTACTEVNTGRTIQTGTQTSGWGTVLVEQPADLYVVNVVNTAPNAPYVNVGQAFQIQAVVENAGIDGVHDARVFIRSNGSSSFETPEIFIDNLAGGQSKSVTFNINAGFIASALETFTLEVSGNADNTGSLVQSGENPVSITIQGPAEFLVPSVAASVDTVYGGQVDPWKIKVPVRNVGTAGFILDKPQGDDILFLNSDIPQNDYKVDPPAALKGGGLRLGGSSLDTLIYTVRSTGHWGGNVTIRARIEGYDENNLNAFTDSSITSIVVRSENNFRIVSTMVRTYNTTESDNGYVNTDQDFRIVVYMENGLGETLDQIRVKMHNSGMSVISDTLLLLDRKLSPSAIDSVEFSIKAAHSENTSGERFTAMIDHAVGEISGRITESGPALDSTAVVYIERPASLSLMLNQDNEQGDYAISQTFKVTAALQNAGTSGVDRTGRARITLPTGYTLSSMTDTLSIGLGSPAEWIVRAPNIAQPERTISVTLDRVPNDLNTKQKAAVTSVSADIAVTTVASALTIGLSVNAPAGAMDRILSAGQTFVILAYIQKQNVREVVAELSLPDGFRTSDNLEKPVGENANVVFWQIQAPDDIVQDARIFLNAHGVDILQPGLQVIGPTQLITVSTVSAADLELTVEIISPSDALDGTLSPGQDFVLQAILDNLGDAGFEGDAVVTLSDLPEGYTTSEPVSKVMVNNAATWTIRAPDAATGKTTLIEAGLTGIPKDVNTGEAAKISRRSDKIGVTTKDAWLAVSVIPMPQVLGNSVIVGQEWARFMILEMENRGAEGANQIRINTLSFYVLDLDGNEIPPQDLFDGLMLVDNEDTTQVYGTLQNPGTSNPLVIPLSRAFNVAVGKIRQLAIVGQLSEDKTVSYFELNIPGPDYITATDLNSGFAVTVAGAGGDPFTDLRSEPFKIFNPAVEDILWNSPNPFGEPGKEETQIHFYLEEETGVVLRLYTLLGQLVWSKDISIDELRPYVGATYTTPWNGYNDRQMVVLNGVYILIMETDSGKIYKTKVAVVK